MTAIEHLRDIYRKLERKYYQKYVEEALTLEEERYRPHFAATDRRSEDACPKFSGLTAMVINLALALRKRLLVAGVNDRRGIPGILGRFVIEGCGEVIIAHCTIALDGRMMPPLVTAGLHPTVPTLRAPCAMELAGRITPARPVRLVRTSSAKL